MENYDKQITSEVTKTPKNKKKIVLISVIAAVVVLLILLSSLIPALILRNEIYKVNYFTFRPNDDENAYELINANIILPESIIIPAKYNGFPIEKVTISSKTLKKIKISEHVKDFEFYCPNLEIVEIDKKNQNFIIENEIVYSSDKSVIHFCLPQKEGDFIIPNHITWTKVRHTAFINCNLANLYIPLSFDIEEYAYYSYALDSRERLRFDYSTCILNFECDTLNPHGLILSKPITSVINWNCVIPSY